MVSAPDITPSDAALIVDVCADSLSVAKFSDLLQSPNIEGHIVLYWAIVNKRQEAFFNSQLGLLCAAGCDSKDGHLRRSLSYFPDDVQVHEGDGSGENQFIACICVRMFRKTSAHYTGFERRICCRVIVPDVVTMSSTPARRIWMLRGLMRGGALGVVFLNLVFQRVQTLYF
ncbi:uncharacterized protein HD556DRAFT_1436776 [Suillus plorans]|uniref:Uncharacterized protein n=1 Tax=Suillus plorans TaxID=116603 RepID=A0A9P7DZT2_9AGAM|nr:uncharacterized protein HD556DRAFT_1436776 [Suillus plorans]KAG1806837.1 hypothetical protein HD556DRAFT_1436776 [Suillus plorans]